MKKIFFILSAILILQSCTNKDEQLKKEIVGKYTYSTLEEDEEDDITTIASINATCSFNADGTYEDSGTLMITCIDEEGYQTNLKYKIEIFGKYDIQKSYIVYDCNLENIKIILLQTDDYDISNLLDEHYIPQMKQEMLLHYCPVKILGLEISRVAYHQRGHYLVC